MQNMIRVMQDVLNEALVLKLTDNSNILCHRSGPIGRLDHSPLAVCCALHL